MSTPFKTEKEIDNYGDLLFKMCPQHPLLPLRFTGWKYPWNYHTKGPKVLDWNAGFVAQWVWWEDQWAYYVNLPGMQTGKTEKGGSFNIGEERVFNGEATPETITRLVTEGRSKLMKLLSDNGVDVSRFMEYST